MQRATRNTFHQKGGEVQKIDQHGIWAIIESSYLNPEYERICIQGETPYDEDEVISVAKWVYRCRRLLRKKDHIIVILYNGEIFEPCYFIEPSIHTRFENGTLVWLEPLPQLNGYLLFPGGLPECTGSEYYYLYGSGSASGPSGIGSDYGSGSGSDIVSGYYGSDSGYYGSVSVSGIDYGSASGTSGISGTGGTGGTGIIDCSALLNCLCVQKDSQGRVTGVFIRKPDGSLVEIGECPVGSGGSGIGSCCPPTGALYVVEYEFTLNGETYRGTTDPVVWSDGELVATGHHYHPSCPPLNEVCIWFEIECFGNAPPSSDVTFFCGGCGINPVCFLDSQYNDFDVQVLGCPGTNPTFIFTVTPGNHQFCQNISGHFIVRPASGNSGGSSGNNGGGGGGNNQTCCPPNGASYVMDYDITLSGTPYSGTSDIRIWIAGSIYWMVSIGGWQCYLMTQANCNNGNVSFSVSYMCPGQNCIADADDFDYTITGCPGNPTISITVKPGHPCLSGSFTLRPYSSDNPPDDN